MPAKTSFKRIPDAYRLVKSLTEAEVRFHKQLRAILRKRSERSDKLFDVFRSARDYKPELVAEVLGNTYNPHNAAMLMKLLKRQILTSLRIYQENHEATLKELAEQGLRHVEYLRLGKKTSKDSVKSEENHIGFTPLSGKEENKESSESRPILQSNFHSTTDNKKAAAISEEQRKRIKKQEKWLEWIQKGRPEKALKKWKDMKKAGLAEPEHEQLLLEALERRVKSLAESGRIGEAVELIYLAEKRNFRIAGAREIMRAWLSHDHPA
jgi:hypothetical protein